MQAVESTLTNVSYEVNFVLDGEIDGRSLSLCLEAKIRVRDIQEHLEVAMFGASANQVGALSFSIDGEELLPHLPLYKAGVEDGSTIVVSSSSSRSDTNLLAAYAGQADSRTSLPSGSV